jgi:RHS repeat-associated protein
LTGGASYVNSSGVLTGNQTAIGGYAFGYDAENRMTSSTINSSTTNYVYDGNGHRVSKTTGGATTTYVYDAMDQLIAEYGTPTDSGTKYISVDHLGSTRLLTDTAQNQEICFDYLPFGEQIASGTDGRAGCYSSTATPLTQKFTGKERDQETNNDFFQARYMSAFQMRFTSSDPLGNFVANAADPQSWNMYAYARNNPLTLVDPTGLDYCDYGQGYTDADPAFGGATQQECADAGGSWQYSVAFTDTVDQNNSGQESGDPGDDGTGGPSPGQPGGPTQNRLACAAGFGQNHSLAAAFGAQNTFVGNLLGGNTVSGIIGLGQIAFGNKAPDVNTVGAGLLNGVRQGIPGSGPSSGLTGPLSNQIARVSSSATHMSAVYAFDTARGSWNVASTFPGSAAEEAALSAVPDAVAPLAAETLTNVATGVGLAKFALDLGTVAYGYAFACH